MKSLELLILVVRRCNNRRQTLERVSMNIKRKSADWNKKKEKQNKEFSEATNFITKHKSGQWPDFDFRHDCS